MQSIAFPKMFSKGSRTNVVQDREAIKENIRLLFLSEKTSLFGDPEYGTELSRYLFSHPIILKDRITDELYTNIKVYIPQVHVDRKDIEIIVNTKNNKLVLSANIKVTYLEDSSNDMYNIKLIERDN